jgi:hypothetical protein
MMQINFAGGGSSTSLTPTAITAIVAVSLFFIRAWLDRRSDANSMRKLLSVSVDELSSYCNADGDFSEELRANLSLFEKNLDKLSRVDALWDRYLDYRACCLLYMREKSISNGGDRTRIAEIAEKLMRIQ